METKVSSELLKFVIQGLNMSRVCDLTGKRRLVGNRVSHANNKTKMTQKPNLHTKRVFDPATGQTIKFRLSAKRSEL